MLKIIFLGLLVVVAVAAGIMAIFFKPSLSRDELAEYITPASRFIDLPNGANMHYRDEGNPNGQVLVMIHGGFGSLHNWEGWVKNLKDDYRLVSMDLLGHGLTGAYPDQVYTRIAERDAVHMLLQKLDIHTYTLAGNSFGGGIVLEIALQWPEEVEKLILVNSEGIPNGEGGYDTSMFNNDAPVAPEDPDYVRLSWIEKAGSYFINRTLVKSVIHQMTYNKKLLSDEYIDYFSRQIRYNGNRKSQLLMFRQGMYLVQQNGKQDLLPRLAELTMPTLIMHGAQDTLVPVRVSEKFKESIVQSELVVIDQAGHMPRIEKPKETADTVRSFMQKRRSK